MDYKASLCEANVFLGEMAKVFSDVRFIRVWLDRTRLWSAELGPRTYIW